MIEYSTRQIFFDKEPELLNKIHVECGVRLTFREDESETEKWEIIVVLTASKTRNLHLVPEYRLFF